MYNQEIKEKFLEEFTAGGRNEKSCRAAFEAISRHEEQLGKDYCQMSDSDALVALSRVHICTYSSSVATQTLVRGYSKWCIRTSAIPNVNHSLTEINIDDVDFSENIARLLFKDEEEFIKAIKESRSLDDGYYDIVMMVFAWIGLTQDQSMQLKVSDVDLQNNKVNTQDGNVIKISKDLCDILTRYSKTKIATRMSRQGMREVFRDDSFGLFVRKFSPKNQLGKELTKLQVASQIHDLNEIYTNLGHPPKFTIGNVMSSGAMYRIKCLEDSGVKVSDIKNKDILISTHGFSKKVYEIMWLYENYKRAFKM